MYLQSVTFTFDSRNELHAFVNCAMVLTKRLNFFIFQLPKAEQRPLHTCQLRRGRVFEAKKGALTIVNCGMKQKDLIQVRQCQSRNSPGFNPSIHRHSGI
jgi:hypothetical protein